MKFLLLASLLTAGTTAPSSHSLAEWQFGNPFRCTIFWDQPFTVYNYYGCYCVLVNRNNHYGSEDLNRCCQIHHHCYAQVKKLDSCKSTINKPYSYSYLYSCSGNEITCSDENNPCEDFMCNCDRKTASCFSKTPDNQDDKEKYC
ncbi:phospholipase A2 [Sigmodon hispidus]